MKKSGGCIRCNYAYDAWYLQYAAERGLPLLTLDGTLREIEDKMKLTLVESLECEVYTHSKAQETLGGSQIVEQG